MPTGSLSDLSASGVPVKRDLHLVIVLLLVVCLSLTFMTGWKLVAARKAIINNVNVNGLNLAQALATYSEGVVRQGAMLLNGVVERIETEGAGSGALERLDRLLLLQQRAMPQLTGVTLLDRHGNEIVSSNVGHRQAVSGAERAYFIHHRQNPSQDIFLGPPILDRSGREWVMTISRRINDPQGAFMGVAVATLGVKNFLDLFGRIDVGENGSISLALSNGQLLVRYPFRDQDVGRDFSRSPVFREYFEDRKEGTAVYASSLDHIERFAAFRRSDNLPLIVTVARETSEVLRGWRLDALWSLLVLAALILFTMAVGWALWRHTRQRIANEARLHIAGQELLSTNLTLEQLALRDPLTGLANRRGFDEALRMEVGRARREGGSLALLLVDIDFFKRFNDTLGHVAGDECLRKVGEMMGACLRRPADLAARYGGEELALLLPGTSLDGARLVAEEVLVQLRRLSITHPASPYERVTASIGIACFSGAQLQDEVSQLVQAADQALYRAKAGGRNRCESWQPVEMLED